MRHIQQQSTNKKIEAGKTNKQTGQMESGSTTKKDEAILKRCERYFFVSKLGRRKKLYELRKSKT